MLEIPKQKNFLYVSLADKILSYIKEKELKNGDRIPSERKLAELFSTSRATVREAIRILENKGMIEIQIGNGMYLRSDLSDRNYKIEIWKIDYIELLDIKTLLEFHMIEEICSHITEAELRSIEEALKKLEKDYARGAFSIINDNTFHNRIRRLSKNQTMVQLVDNIIAKLDDYGAHIKGIEKIWISTIPYHRQLFDAMKMQDMDKAKVAYYKIYELDKIGLETVIGLK